MRTARVLRRFARNCCGATAAEYAVLLALVGASIIFATLTLGDTIACSIDQSSAVIDGQDVSSGHQYGHSDPNGLAKGHRPATC